MRNNIECRLCSSTTELISLFNGKCRKNRDYIRKLIDITTGIKFQKNDVCKCICFACTIQIYNFYIFRARSIENEKRLQVCTKDNEKIKSHKIEVTDLDDILLPDTEELKASLTPWFISKQKYCESINPGRSINDENSGNIDKTDSSTQYDLVEYVAVSTQHELNSLEASTQTNKVLTRTKKNQCKLVDESTESTTQTSEVDSICHLVEKVDKVTQCEYSSVDVYIQTNPDENETSSLETSTQTTKLKTKTKKIQCQLEKLNRKSCNKSIESSSQTSEDDSFYRLEVEKLDKVTQYEYRGVEVCIQTNTPTNLNESKDCSTPTRIEKECNSTESLYNRSPHNVSFKDCQPPYTRLSKRKQVTPKKLEDISYNKHKESTTQTSETDSFNRVVEKVDRETQYDYCGVEAYIQTNTPTNFNESTQTHTENECDSTESPNNGSRCDLSTKDYQPPYTRFSKRNETPKKEFCMQTSTPNSTLTPSHVESSKECACVESFSKETQCDLYILQGYARRKSLLPNTIKIKGMLSKKNTEESKVKCIDAATQTENSCMASYTHTDSLYNCFYGPVNMPKRLNLDVKQEVETPPMLSPANCLNISLDTTKSEELISPRFGSVSPRSSGLLTLKDKVETVIICPECDRSVYSKSQYKLHRKRHMQCNFCRKKFRSIKQTKLHKEYQCDIQKLTRTVPVVTLIRLESLTDVQKKYPECLDLLKKFNVLGYSGGNEDVKKVVRIRSRSVSDTDSVINCTACKACVSVLSGVSLGVDKSVQANFIFDKDLLSPLELIYKNVCLKRELEDSLSGDGCQLKKVKLSASVSS